MKTTGRLGLISILGAAVFLAAAGAVTAYQELSVFAGGGGSPAGRFAMLSGSQVVAPPSTLGKRLLLDTCVESIGGIYGRMQPSDDRGKVMRACLAQADRIAAASPSASYAWYVGALAAAGLDDSAGFNSRMLRAQLTGANEQAEAVVRVRLVDDNYEDANPQVRERQVADLRLLVGSRHGIVSMSSRYVSHPDFRARITAIVETMSETDQARFVETVGQAAARAKTR